MFSLKIYGQYSLFITKHDKHFSRATDYFWSSYGYEYEIVYQKNDNLNISKEIYINV